MGGQLDGGLKVRYLCVFHLPERATAFELGVRNTPVTDESYDLRRERNSDSGAGAFGDIESVRPVGHPDETLHLGASSGMVVYSLAKPTDTARLLHDEPAVTAQAIRRVSEVLGFPVEASSLLWVHRLLTHGHGGADTSDLVPLAYAMPMPLSRGGRCLIGRGYSLVCTDHEDQIAAVELGIVSATQTWMMVDDASKRAADLVTKVSSTADLSVALGRELGALSMDLVLRVRLLSEFIRRLRTALLDARSSAFEATVQSWALDRELGAVIDRVDSCARLVMMQIDAKRAERDRLRNQLMFVLAFAAIGQWILAGYDFLVADDTAMGSGPRLYIDLLSFAPLLALVVYGARRMFSRHQP